MATSEASNMSSSLTATTAFQPYTKPTPSTSSSYQPTHPGLLRVVLEKGKNTVEGEEDAYSSYLVAEEDIPFNTVITRLTNLTSGVKAYSSVQYGAEEHQHFELNSDLLFVNHSCSPNVAFILTPSPTPTSSSSQHPSEPSDFPKEWALRTLGKQVKKGETLTFFYPSTEWDMRQGFECGCGEETCLREIKGAKYLSREILQKQEYINPHIWAMKEQQEKEGKREKDSS